MQVIRDRRALHAIPELGMELPKTAAYVKTALKDLNCQVFSPLEYAVCAYFDFGAPDFDYVRRIDWTGLGGKPISLYHMPNWPNEETLVPVFAKRQTDEP